MIIYLKNVSLYLQLKQCKKLQTCIDTILRHMK